MSVAFFAFYIILNKLKVHFLIPSLNSIYMRLKSSVDMFISLIFPNLYTSMSTVILQTYCGNTATGIYSGGQKAEYNR